MSSASPAQAEPPWLLSWQSWLSIGAPVPLLLASVALSAALATCWAFRYRWSTRLSVRGRTALVTGAARGLGLETAKRLAELGAAHVILVDVARELDAQSRDVRGAASEDPPRVTAVPGCDVASKPCLDALERRARAALLEGEHVSVLVNCAGVVSGRPFLQLDEATFDRVVAVNLGAQFALLRRFLPAMLERNDGAVVGVSSLMGLMGGAQLADYAASKFGVVGLYESLRLELAAYSGVSLVTVCPYVIDTGMFDGAFEGTPLTRLVATVLPPLSARDAACRLVRALERGQTVAVVPELFAPLINVVRCLPSPVYELVLGLMGAVDGMRTFRGRGLPQAVWGASEKQE